MTDDINFFCNFFSVLVVTVKLFIYCLQKQRIIMPLLLNNKMCPADFPSIGSLCNADMCPLNTSYYAIISMQACSECIIPCTRMSNEMYPQNMKVLIFIEKNAQKCKSKRLNEPFGLTNRKTRSKEKKCMDFPWTKELYEPVNQEVNQVKQKQPLQCKNLLSETWKLICRAFFGSLIANGRENTCVG